MKQSTNMTNNSNPVQMYPINEVAKIGRPGYRVTKMKDASTYQKSIMFEIEYPYITNGVIPRYRVMSSFEQKVELPDDKYQYIVFAAEPYETIAFKVPNLEIDNNEDKYYCNWDEEMKIYTVQIYFKDNKNISIITSNH